MPLLVEMPLIKDKTGLMYALGRTGRKGVVGMFSSGLGPKLTPEQQKAEQEKIEANSDLAIDRATQAEIARLAAIDPSAEKSAKLRLEAEAALKKETGKRIRRAAIGTREKYEQLVAQQEEKQKVADDAINRYAATQNPADEAAAAAAQAEVQQLLPQVEAAHQDYIQSQTAYSEDPTKWRNHATPCWKPEERMQYRKLTNLEDEMRKLRKQISERQRLVDHERQSIPDTKEETDAELAEEQLEEAQEKARHLEYQAAQARLKGLRKGGSYKSLSRKRKILKNKSRKNKGRKTKRLRKLRGGATKREKKLINSTSDLQTAEALYHSLRSNYFKNPGHWSDFNWRHRPANHPQGRGNLWSEDQGPAPCYELAQARLALRQQRAAAAAVPVDRQGVPNYGPPANLPGVAAYNNAQLEG